MEVLGVHRFGQLQRVPGAFDVGDPLAVGVGSEVVDRGEVEEVLDLAVELLDVLGRDAEPLLREVTDDRDDAAVVVAEPVAQVVELLE